MDAFLELFSTEGRANRAWYIWHVLLDDVAIFGLVVSMVIVGSLVGNAFMVLPFLGALVGGVWAATAVTIKRLHDLGRPGWHFLGLMIPFYNIYLGCLLAFVRGTPGPNEYGPDPLAASADYDLLGA